MFRIKKLSREKQIRDEVNSLVYMLTEDYTDVEICEIVNEVRERSLAYLNHRKEVISNELEQCIDSIKKLTN